VTTPQYDDATLTYDDPSTRYDGGCVSSITYDEAGVSWDALEITYDGCDHRTDQPQPETAEPTGAYGRAGVDWEAMTRRMRREDEDLLALI
jgi:hypothetical protein